MSSLVCYRYRGSSMHIRSGELASAYMSQACQPLSCSRSEVQASLHVLLCKYAASSPVLRNSCSQHTRCARCLPRTHFHFEKTGLMTFIVAINGSFHSPPPIPSRRSPYRRVSMPKISSPALPLRSHKHPYVFTENPPERMTQPPVASTAP